MAPTWPWAAITKSNEPKDPKEKDIERSKLADGVMVAPKDRATPERAKGKAKVAGPAPASQANAATAANEDIKAATADCVFNMKKTPSPRHKMPPPLKTTPAPLLLTTESESNLGSSSPP